MSLLVNTKMSFVIEILSGVDWFWKKMLKKQFSAKGNGKVEEVTSVRDIS